MQQLKVLGTDEMIRLCKARGQRRYGHQLGKYVCGLRNIGSSKAGLMNHLTSDDHIDLFCLTETRLCQEEYDVLNESTPPPYINTHTPPATGRGGGVTASSL